MRHYSWKLAVCCWLGLGACITGDAQGQQGRTPLREAPVAEQPITPRDTFAGRADFHPNSATAPEKTAEWGRAEAGYCAIEGPKITIRKDGTASFSGEVASGDTGDRYCVILDFFDRNQVRLWHFPRICTPFDLGQGWAVWTNHNLAIPEAHYPHIVFATRQDHC